VLLGAAARLPLARGEVITAEDAVAGGVHPAAAVRHGLRRGLDLGLLASGTDGAIALRAEHVVTEGSTRKVLLYGVRAFGGAVVARESDDDRGYRLGLDLPVLFALDIGGLYEGSFGFRGGVELLDVDGGAQGAKRGAIIRGGPSLGFGLGLRRVHGMIELGVGVEGRTGSVGAADGRVGGYLLPAFALRLRP
jgi:hypothetical protein